jgi:hypothetical protein
MLGHLAGELPQDALLLVNIQDPNEYFDEIRIYLNEILGRPDVTVQAVQAGQSLDLHPAEAATYLLAPAVQNQMLMTVRMGVIETTVQSWNAALPENLTPQDPSVFQVREKFWNFSIDFPRLFCGLIQSRGFCATPQPLLDRRLFQYGWDLYLLER